MDLLHIARCYCRHDDDDGSSNDDMHEAMGEACIYYYSYRTLAHELVREGSNTGEGMASGKICTIRPRNDHPIVALMAFVDGKIHFCT